MPSAVALCIADGCTESVAQAAADGRPPPLCRGCHHALKRMCRRRYRLAHGAAAHRAHHSAIRDARPYAPYPCLLCGWWHFGPSDFVAEIEPRARAAAWALLDWLDAPSLKVLRAAWEPPNGRPPAHRVDVLGPESWAACG